MRKCAACAEAAEGCCWVAGGEEADKGVGDPERGEGGEAGGERCDGEAIAEPGGGDGGSDGGGEPGGEICKGEPGTEADGGDEGSRAETGLDAEVEAPATGQAETGSAGPPIMLPSAEDRRAAFDRWDMNSESGNGVCYHATAHTYVPRVCCAAH